MIRRAVTTPPAVRTPEEQLELAVKALYAVAHRDRYVGQLDDMRYCSLVLWHLWSRHRLGMLESRPGDGILEHRAMDFDRLWQASGVNFPWLRDPEAR